jgi:hypothetical protein
LPITGERSAWDAGDFCRRTACPVCGAEVYFVRHNGGSVWFDDLGQPWPKHACFEEQNSSTHLREVLYEQLQMVAKPVFGVVIETVVIDPGKSGRMVVRCSDGLIIEDVFETELNLNAFVGALVIIERSNEGRLSLLRVSSSLYFWRRRPRLAKGARFKHNHRVYIWDGRHWFGADDYTIAPTGLQQRLTAMVYERLKAIDPEDEP